MRAGAAMVLVTMKLAVVGSPMPRKIEATMVKIRVSSRLPPARVTIAWASFSPNPVRVAVPMISPTVAQAQATPKAPRAPFSRPSHSLAGVSHVSRRK